MISTIFDFDSVYQIRRRSGSNINGHPIYGRVNIDGIVSRSEGGVDIIPSFAASHVFAWIIYSLGIPTLFDQTDNELKIQCIVDTFDWIVDMHNESVTPHIEKGSRFIICRAANPTILASLLQQHRSGASPTS
jgi:hypothetical protein